MLLRALVPKQKHHADAWGFINTTTRIPTSKTNNDHITGLRLWRDPDRVEKVTIYLCNEGPGDAAAVPVPKQKHHAITWGFIYQPTKDRCLNDKFLDYAKGVIQSLGPGTQTKAPCYRMGVY